MHVVFVYRLLFLLSSEGKCPCTVEFPFKGRVKMKWRNLTKSLLKTTWKTYASVCLIFVFSSLCLRFQANWKGVYR